MKRLLAAFAAAGLLLLTSAALAENITGENKPSPISQTLVREGDFALDLAAVLKLGDFSTEAEAEDTLTSAGISPENGWIADYPVTPDVLAELQDKVGRAAETGKLALAKGEALKAFDDLAVEYGLAIRPSGEGEYADRSGDIETGEYTAERVEGPDYYDTEVIREYYYTEGPPVITYYTPPWDYYYLYSWVPYPFWGYGYWYPGYFILADFSCNVTTRHHHHRHNRDWDRDADTTRVVSNHVRDRSTGRVARVDPVSRKSRTVSSSTTGDTTDVRATRDRTRMNRGAAESILKRDIERSTKSERGSGWTVRGDSKATRLDGSSRSITRSGDSDRVRSRSSDRSVERTTRLGDSDRNRSRSSDRSVERATRLGDPDRNRSRSSDRSFERATRLGDSDRGRSWGSSRSADRSASRPSRSFSSGGGGNKSFSRPSRSFSSGGGGGNKSFSAPSRGFGGGGGGRGGGCRGKNC